MEITAQHIELYASAEAPEDFMAWARESSRTYGAISSVNSDWALWIVQCAATPEGVLSFFKSNSDWRIRMFVALNATSFKVLDHLKRDPDFNVRAALPENPNVTPAILQDLQHDPDEDVRANVSVYLPSLMAA